MIEFLVTVAAVFSTINAIGVIVLLARERPDAEPITEPERDTITVDTDDEGMV